MQRILTVNYNKQDNNNDNIDWEHKKRQPLTRNITFWNDGECNSNGLLLIHNFVR